MPELLNKFGQFLLIKLLMIICLIINNNLYAKTTLSEQKLKQAVLDIIKIKNASKQYLQDIRAWPTHINVLLNTNYLESSTYKDYLIFKTNDKLSIAFQTPEENVSFLKKYLTQGVFDKTKKLFYINAAPEFKKTITKDSVITPASFFCSNLYCQKF